MSRLDDELLPVFARQHWLVSLEHVVTAGGSRTAAAYRVSTGRWELAEVDVFRLVGPTPTWHAGVLAPLLAIGPSAAASHTTAAALHGVPGFGRGVPEITVPRGAEHRRDKVVIHTSTDLGRARIVTVEGIPTTSIPRTVLDLARTTGEGRLLRVIEWARRTQGVEWADLVQVLAQHARCGRPGITRLRRVLLANMDRAEVTDSDFELFFLGLLRERSLPEPVLHHRVVDGARFVAEVDVAYPELKIAIELDGRIHLEHEVRERDLPRQNDLVLLGWTVLRFSWERFRARPDAVIAEVRAAIHARTRATAC